MWQIDTKVNNYGSAWVDMYLLDTSDPVEGDADPGGVPINIGDLEPSNETLYRLANNLKIIENQFNSFAGVTVNTTPATIGTLQTALDALGKTFPYGIDIEVIFGAGTYTIPAAGIIFQGFSGGGNLTLWDGISLRTGTYLTSAILLQKVTALPIFQFIDCNINNIRMNGLTLQNSGIYYNAGFDNCKSRILVDSCYINHQTVGNGGHLSFKGCSDIIIENVATQNAANSILLEENSNAYIDNTGTNTVDPGTSRFRINSGSRVHVNSHNYTNSLADNFDGGILIDDVLRIQLGSGEGVNFTVYGDITTSAGGAGKVLRIDNDQIWVYRYTGTWASGNTVDNANPYAAPVGTIGAVPVTQKGIQTDNT